MAGRNNANCFIAVTSHNKSSVTISDIRFDYPARIICPKYTSDRCLHAYLLTYGGGLVSGDGINVTITISGSNAWLFLLSQSATKIYRSPRTGHDINKVTKTSLRADIYQESTFCWLPEPIMPFRESDYRQQQDFYLHLPAAPLPSTPRKENNATPSDWWSKWPSVCMLDWLSSGRKSRGEIWQLSSYHSLNRLYLINGNASSSAPPLLQDGLCLQQTSPAPGESPQDWPEPFNDTLKPFTVFGTILLCGPKMERLTEHLIRLAGRPSDFQRSSSMQNNQTRQSFISCVSPIYHQHGGKLLIGCFVRMASMEVQLMRSFISREIIDPLEAAAGEDSLFRRQR